jgi:hypothetical protein
MAMNWLRKRLHRFIWKEIEIQISEFMRKENESSMGINFLNMRGLSKEESKRYTQLLKDRSERINVE